MFFSGPQFKRRIVGEIDTNAQTVLVRFLFRFFSLVSLVFCSHLFLGLRFPRGFSGLRGATMSVAVERWRAVEAETGSRRRPQGPTGHRGNKSEQA